jgi:hypothetical protein
MASEVLCVDAVQILAKCSLDRPELEEGLAFFHDILDLLRTCGNPRTCQESMHLWMQLSDTIRKSPLQMFLRSYHTEAQAYAKVS